MKKTIFPSSFCRVLDTVINFFKEKLERIIVCLYDKNCFTSLFKLNHVSYGKCVLNHIVKDFKFLIIVSSSFCIIYLPVNAYKHSVKKYDIIDQILLTLFISIICWYFFKPIIISPLFGIQCFWGIPANDENCCKFNYCQTFKSKSSVKLPTKRRAICH